MTNRIFTSLLLSAVLALPAFAQQTSSSSGQSSAQSGQNASGHDDFWDGDEPSFGSLILHPFASKEYVRRHVGAVRDRVNELEELTTANAKSIRDVDSRAQQGVQMASSKTSMADEHATDASNKSQMAHQTATALDTRVSTEETVVSNLDQYKSGTQTEIRFRPGQTVLSKDAKDALEQIASQVKNQHGYIIEVQGYSAGQGQAAIANSKRVADSVLRYFVENQEIPAYRIYVIGVGNVSDGKRMSGSRVEVSVLKNDLAQK